MVALIKLSEDLGFSCAYVGDSQMIWREAYVILGAAAMVTKKITLATGVTNPITRDLGVIAGGWATLREAVGDRLLLGHRRWRQLVGNHRQEALHPRQP